MRSQVAVFFDTIFLVIMITAGVMFFLAFVALYMFVSVAAIKDIWTTVERDGLWTAWEKIALLLIFIRVFSTGRRIRKLEEWVEQLRMTSFATFSYLNVVYGNDRLEKLQGKGLVYISIRNTLKIFVRFITGGAHGDDILHGSYAARDGNKVTLTDDLQKINSAADFKRCP